MPDIELPITNGFYVSRSLPISNQECVNLYVHVNQGGGLAKESLFGTPGIKGLTTTGTDRQINRGAHVMDGIPYFVNGGTLYNVIRSVDVYGQESFTYNALGTVEGMTERVSMDDNGTQLCILVPGGKGYIYNPDAGTPFQEITDPDFRANGNPQHVAFIDGVFIFTTDEKKFISSAINDGLSYNALDFGSAEADPDAVVAPVVSKNQLYICGTETIEQFYNNAANTGAAFPWTRVQGGSLGVGVFAPFSLLSVADTFFFIGGSPRESASVYMVAGGSAQIISTDAINYVLEQLSESQLSSVFAWSYSENGARFVGWTLPTTTIVYDMTSQRWHERRTRFITPTANNETRWRPNSIVKAYARIMCGDSVDGRIGEVSLDEYGEYGEDIYSRLSIIPLSNLGDRIFVPRLELTVESGVGNSNVPNPKVIMQRSKDGKTWSDNLDRKIGKVGEYGYRAIWRRLGRVPRMEVFRFSISDQVKKVFIKLEAKIK